MLLRKQVDSCAFGAPLGFAGDEIFEIGRAQPEWMLDVYFMGMGWTFFYNIDRVVRRDAFFTVAGDDN